jgi:hypothetical protein
MSSLYLGLDVFRLFEAEVFACCEDLMFARNLPRINCYWCRGPGELDNSGIVAAVKARNQHYEQLVADALKNIPTK